MLTIRKARGRGPVVFLDRLSKAKMIEAILEDFLNGPVKGLRMLDIGCGNGQISGHFSKNNDQYAVDIADMRDNKKARFHFCPVDSEVLPFEDGFFDVVLSHHIIEHVENQSLHLDEIKRVLKRTGICYLATPNKTSPMMEGHIGNEKVLYYKQMVPFFERHGYICHEYSVKVVKAPEKFFAEKKYGEFIPLCLANLLKPLFPSQMFILEPNKEGVS